MSGLRTRVVTPSSALGDPTRLQRGLELLRRWGLELDGYPDPTRHWGYFAGTDSERPSSWW